MSEGKGEEDKEEEGKKIDRKREYKGSGWERRKRGRQGQTGHEYGPPRSWHLDVVGGLTVSSSELLT